MFNHCAVCSDCSTNPYNVTLFLPVNVPSSSSPRLYRERSNQNGGQSVGVCCGPCGQCEVGQGDVKVLRCSLLALQAWCRWNSLSDSGWCSSFLVDVAVLSSRCRWRWCSSHRFCFCGSPNEDQTPSLMKKKTQRYNLQCDIINHIYITPQSCSAFWLVGLKAYFIEQLKQTCMSWKESPMPINQHLNSDQSQARIQEQRCDGIFL